MFYFIYIAFLLFISITIWQLINKNLMNEDLIFLLLCNYLLNITTALFFGFYNSLTWSLISSFLLLIFAVILYFKIIKTFNKFKFFPLPYLSLVFFVFYFILFNII